MPKHVLVVGAGIIGASIAWHLARAGCRVTVAGQPGGVATPASLSWINATWGNPEFYFHFRRRSMAGWRRLEAALPGIRVDWCGGLLWDLPEDDLRAFAEQHARWGYGIRLVDGAEARRLEPGLLERPRIAVHVAEEGAVEPVAAGQMLMSAAADEGAMLMADMRAASLIVEGERIAGISTASGERVEADETVLAAGTATADLLATAGIGLRVASPPGLIAHSTVAADRLLSGMVFSPDVHLRQTQEGRLIAGADFTGADPGEDPTGTARELFEVVKRSIAGAEALDLAFHTVGYRPTPADGFPAIGRMPSTAGLYVAVMHSGVTLAPLVGELAAREIARDERDPDLAPYDPGRAALS